MDTGHAAATTPARTAAASLAVAVILATGLAATGTAPMLHAAYAEPSVDIIMEKTTYTYCEKLLYTIQVSEVTGQPAIIHITDQAGKASSAIPIPIEGAETPVRSSIAFDKSIFPLGTYTVDVQYAGTGSAAEFVLIDSGRICIPELMRPMMGNWIGGNIIDGFLISAFQKYVDPRIVDIPFEIDQDNIYDIDIPDWVQAVGLWWLEERISDGDLANVLNYLTSTGVISTSQPAAGADGDAGTT